MRSSCFAILFLCAVCGLSAQRSLLSGSFTMEQIVTDIYGQLTEDEASDVDYEQLYDDLVYLAANPIDINNADDVALCALPFLSQRQRDDIRYFVSMYGEFHGIEELQLINSLADYDIRNIEPFVVFTSKIRSSEVDSVASWRDGLFSRTRHVATVRSDYRSNADVSPYYLTTRYQFTAGKRLSLGVNATKYAGQPWSRQGFNHYGLYAQLSDVSRVVKRIVIGDYRADYGCGLVVSSRWMSGVSQLLESRGAVGLRARSSASQSGSYFRGVGVSLNPSSGSEISTFYSYRHVSERDSGQHVVGFHAGYVWKHVKVGGTVLARFSDIVKPYSDRPYTANYNTAGRSVVGSVDYALTFKNVEFIGETALMRNAVATQNTLSLMPIAMLRLVVMQRYYSPRYDNVFARSYSHYSRVNDESGLYLGAVVNVKNSIRMSFYADGYSTRYLKSRIYQPTVGFDYVAQVNYQPRASLLMDWRTRWKRGEENYMAAGGVAYSGRLVDLASLRYRLSYQNGSLTVGTVVHGNVSVVEHGDVTLGASLSQSVGYRWRVVSLQGQMTAFHALDYNNRIYMHERDVLYAFSMPVLYGSGLRYSFNVSWRIVPQLILQLHVAQTLYDRTTSYNRHPFTARLQLRASI